MTHGIECEPLLAWAQRLWALQRPRPARSPDADVYGFVSAIAIVADGAVHVGFVRSCDVRLSTEECLLSPRVRLSIARQATSFATLDAAIAWADKWKRTWIGQGWADFEPD